MHTPVTYVTVCSGLCLANAQQRPTRSTAAMPVFQNRATSHAWIASRSAGMSSILVCVCYRLWSIPPTHNTGTAGAQQHRDRATQVQGLVSPMHPVLGASTHGVTVTTMPSDWDLSGPRNAVKLRPQVPGLISHRLILPALRYCPALR